MTRLTYHDPYPAAGALYDVLGLIQYRDLVAVKPLVDNVNVLHFVMTTRVESAFMFKVQVQVQVSLNHAPSLCGHHTSGYVGEQYYIAICAHCYYVAAATCAVETLRGPQPSPPPGTV